jgi:hypothetical protein
LERVDNKAASESRQSTYGGVSALIALTEGTSYPTVKAYYDVIEDSLNLASDLGFIAKQDGVKSLKSSIKEISRRQTLTEAMHRDINRAILHFLVTRPGSPIFESNLLYEPQVVYNHMEGGLEDILNRMKDIVGGESNLVLESLDLEATQTQKGEFTKIVLNTDKINTTLQKNYFTATLKGMMDNPSLYGKENKETVEKFIEAFVSNSILTSGFSPSPASTFELIPVDYFKRLGVSKHLKSELKKLEGSNDLSWDFLNNFIVNYGHHKFGGEYLFKKPYKGYLSSTINLPNRTEKYIIAVRKDKKTGIITTAIYQSSATPGIYNRVQSKGQQRLLYESNLKDADGKAIPNTRSIINPIQSTEVDPFGYPEIGYDVTEPILEEKQELESAPEQQASKSKISLLERETPVAGIDVTVVEAELPPGEKGQVVGDLIIIDPNQIEADTVYHEFGHILVDMLPEYEVDGYIKQVKRLNPELAELVQAKYPELSGRELGKEILVTAIGI